MSTEFICALEPGELDLFVSSAQPSNIKTLGSKGWMEWHQRFQKLQQQAVLEATGYQEEITRNTIISCGKVPVVLHEAICVCIWRQNILPKILKQNPSLKHTFLLYAVLYHETVAVGLLEMLIFDEEACSSIEDLLTDLVDYCAEMITSNVELINSGYLKPQGNENVDGIAELVRQQKDLQFDIGMRCITIISCLSNVLDKIHISASSRMYGTHDVPLLLVELLELEPWKKRNQEESVLHFTDGRWKAVDGQDLDRMCRSETLCWLALWRLVLNPSLSNHYDITNYRKARLCKLVYRITDLQLDQLPVLEELKRSLGRLGVADVSIAPPSSRRPVLLEVIPQIKPAILRKIERKAASIAKKQVEEYFQPNDKETVELAKMLSSTYTSEAMEVLGDGEAKCSLCGDPAPKKCSRCRTEWYCGRECQVKRWPKHKEICDQFSKISTD